MSEQSHHEEEVLGKAYDGRLMRRLLQSLRPYHWTVIAASLTLILHSSLQVIGPFLTKVAVDRYLVVTDRQPTLIDRYLPADPVRGLGEIAILYFGILI